MSGHSKWATTKHKKALIDAKRSKNFSKLANLITVAARRGADPASNPALRDAINKAREFNLPADNVQRAIARGTGAIPGTVLEEFVLEALGPAGLMLLIKVITDNKNRSLGEIKKVLSLHGGRLADPGSVSWMFNEAARTTVNKEEWQSKPTSPELAVIDAGASDVKEEGGKIAIYSTKESAENVRRALEQAGLAGQTEIDYLAKNPLVVPTDQQEKITEFLETIYDLPDVDEVYPNTQL